MKKRLTFFSLIMLFCLTLSAQEKNKERTRYVMCSTTFGAGGNNLYEAYLSPLEYKGWEVRITNERLRMTRMLKGNVSGQSLFNISFARDKNPSGSGYMYYGMLNWSYALHYQFNMAKGLKVLAGPFLDLNAGVVYNQRNSNNPAQAKAYGNIGASAMAIYKFRIRHYPMTARYQLDLPLIGMTFSPEYGQSYYDIFVLGHSDNVVKFTSLHNAPSMRHMLTLDFPVGKTIMRIGYTADIRQSKLNQLKSHAYSNCFMIGFVRNIYRIKGKDRTGISEKYTPF